MGEASLPSHGLSPRALTIAGWSAFLAAGLLFIAIAWNVAGHSALVVVDARVAAWLHMHRSPALTAVMLAVTTLNSTLGIGLWSAIVVAWLARRREWPWALAVALAVGGGLGLNVLFKTAFERARPHFDDPLVTLSTFSFPSGHTAGATLFYGAIAAYFAARTPGHGRRSAYFAAAIAAVTLVAFSRIYLGAHYLSDVAAAACASTAWLVLCIFTVHGMVRRRSLAGGTAAPPFRWRWVLAGVAIALLAGAALMLPLREQVDHFQDWLQYMDLVPALFAFVALYGVASLALVPASLFAVAAGVVFGFGWGMLATLAGAALGAVAPFMLTRHLLRARVERFAKRNEAFRAMGDAVKKEPWKMVALLRLSPVLPSPVKSYFLGLCSVRLATYASASLAGMLPGLLLRVYIGAAGRDALSRDAGPLQWTLLALSIAATVGVSILIGRITRRRLAF